MASKYNLGGVVLAGGLATRMGFDKATLTGKNSTHQSGYKQDYKQGQTILHCNYTLLSKFCSKVWVACRADVLREGYTCIPDVVEGRGPAGAIHASLLHAKTLGLDGILIVACDMPSVTEEAIERLCKARLAQGDDFAYYDILEHSSATLMTAYWQPERDFLQSLLAIYEVDALPYYERAVQEDKLKLRWIVPHEAQRRIVYTTPSKAQEDIFFNLNTPKDVETWRKALR